MRRLLTALSCFLVVLVVCAGAVPASAPPTFLVGTAAVDANPATPVCLGGYGSFCTRPMTGVKDPLLARALAVTGTDGETVVLVTTTNIGLFAAYKDTQGANGIYDIRQRIAAVTPVASDHVVVVSDHSHAGPDTIGIWGGVEKPYMDLLAQAAVDAAAQAVAAQRPAHLSVAAVQGPPLQSSYRDVRAIPDAEFRALFADDATTGERIATFVNYAPHATVLGSNNEMATGDWAAWGPQEAEQLWPGSGAIATLASLGATDWRKIGNTSDEKEQEARTRLRTLLVAADQAAQPLTSGEVGAVTTFVREEVAQPVLLANYGPGLDYGEGDVRIDRAITPPWLTGSVLGTYAGAVRIGEVFVSTIPGEPFPQLQNDLRERGGVTGTAAHFMLGGAQDFLGYMVTPLADYQQVLTEGATFLAGCPEEAVLDGAGQNPDGACPDHWTLMVSPTIGAHVVCTVQDAAQSLGFGVDRQDACEVLTATDGQQAPAETPADAR